MVPISRATLSAARRLLGKGIVMKVKSAADDVGIEMAGGRRRVAKTQNNRIKGKARRRGRRIRGLVKKNKSALRLIMFGVAPQQSYGQQVNGLSRAQNEAMRYNFKLATHF